MRSTLLIAGKDLRLRIRDRSAFIVGLIVPFGLAFIFSLILGDVEDGPIDLRFAVVAEDSSENTAAFIDALERLEADGILTLTTAESAASARILVDSGEVGAAFVVPGGFGAAVDAGSPATVTVLAHPDRQTSASIARSIAETFAANIEGVRLVAATASVVGANVADTVAMLHAAPPPVSVAGVEAADRQLDLTTFFVAGMAVFFLFFTVQFGVTSLLEERQQGTLARLLAAPIARRSVIGAKALVSLVLGVVSMTVLIVASSVLLGARWGDPLGVAVLVVAGVISAVGIMAVVAAFARTPEGAGNLQSVIAVAFGMLGGVFFPTPLGEGVLAQLALITPHRWFMTGLGDLAGGGGLSVVMPSVLVLVAFGAVTGGLAALRLRKAVEA